MSLGSVLQFKELCDIFEGVLKLNKPPQRFNELKQFFTDCRRKINEIKSHNPETNTSLYPILRLMLPNLERERGPYGLKIKTLTDLYLRVFCIGKQTPEAQQLKGYREPTENEEVGSDFAEKLYFALRKRLPGRPSSFSVEQTNSFLNNVAQKHSENQSKTEIFKNFILEINALELKWITKIILKDMKLGISQKKIFEAFHPDAEKLFNVKSSLKEVCEKLTDLSVRISNSADIKIEIFSHFKPMLLERCAIEETGQFFSDDESKYFIQEKHDGERFQIHIKNGVFKYFTRQGYDITAKPMYGQTSTSDGFLTKHISDLLNKNCNSVILDGELMGYHKQKKTFGSKGMNYDVKNLKHSSAHQPCFIAFDIILYNDELLINKPYYERLKILESAFTEKEGILIKSKTVILTSSKELIQHFNKSLDNDDEGIVLKKYDHLYRPNVREKSGCYKIKAEFSDNLINDIDAIILGGYYGEGKWIGKINSFLMGIADAPLKEGDVPSIFQALVAVSSGFKHQILRELNEKFKKHSKKRCPTNVIGPRNELPNVWIDPKDSIIIQIRATEIIKSKDYLFGYTLRFPRVVKIRNDKAWHDASTTTEFLSLIKNSDMVQKLTKRHATDDDVTGFVSKRQRKSTNNPKLRVSKFDESTFGINPHEVIRLTRLFNNREICVINGNNEVTKQNIETILYQHMAKVVQNPRTNTFCVIAANPKPLKVKNIIQSQKYDVVTLNWLNRVTKKENWRSLNDFYPWELLSMKLSTKRRFQQLYDNFYDSYTVDATVESLTRSFEKTEECIEDENNQRINRKEVDEELFENGISPFSIFRKIVAYFHPSVEIEKYTFQFLSGNIAQDPNNATYIIIDKSTGIRDIDINPNTSTIFVSSQWISDCFQEKTLLPIAGYVLQS